MKRKYNLIAANKTSSSVGIYRKLTGTNISPVYPAGNEISNINFISRVKQILYGKPVSQCSRSKKVSRTSWTRTCFHELDTDRKPKNGLPLYRIAESFSRCKIEQLNTSKDSPSRIESPEKGLNSLKLLLSVFSYFETLSQNQDFRLDKPANTSTAKCENDLKLLLSR